jgi:hypothetical protein
VDSKAASNFSFITRALGILSLSLPSRHGKRCNRMHGKTTLQAVKAGKVEFEDFWIERKELNSFLMSTTTIKPGLIDRCRCSWRMLFKKNDRLLH